MINKKQSDVIDRGGWNRSYKATSDRMVRNVFSQRNEPRQKRGGSVLWEKEGGMTVER